MLAQSGIDVEVVDVRTLMPLDKQTIFASVEKTNRVIVTDEEAKRGGALLRLPRSLPRSVLTPSMPGETCGGRECPDAVQPGVGKARGAQGGGSCRRGAAITGLVRRTAIAPPVWRGASPVARLG